VFWNWGSAPKLGAPAGKFAAKLEGRLKVIGVPEVLEGIGAVCKDHEYWVGVLGVEVWPETKDWSVWRRRADVLSGGWKVLFRRLKSLEDIGGGKWLRGSCCLKFGVEISCWRVERMVESWDD